MPFKPNYRQARGERDRAKQQKKQAKLRKREEEAAARKPELDPDGVETAAPDPEVGEDEQSP